MGEFVSKELLLHALRALKKEGLRRIDTYTPYPVEEVSEVLDLAPSAVRWFGLAGALGGAAFGYFLQWYCNAFDFPILVGARPFHSLPAWIPITFESAVLGSALSIFFAVIAHFGLPRMDHPLFELAQFDTASIDGFWVSVTSEDRREVEKVLTRLRELGARHTSTVDDPGAKR